MPAFYSYDSNIRIEDVKEIITNVDIKETPFISSIATSVAHDTEHKWMTDTYDAAADNAGIEAADPTYPTLNDPSKVSNITQILRKPFQISWTKLNIRHHGMSDNWAYQKVKKTIALKKDLELAALFGTVASGTGSAARRMKGLISFISTYKENSAFSGLQLSFSIFSVLAQNVWTNSQMPGGNLLLGAYQKRRVSEQFASFNSANRREIVVGERTLSVPIDTVESDFGQYEVLLSHDMNTVLPGSIVAYKPEFHKLAFLEGSEPQAVEYAPTGLSKKGEVWCEATLEVYNEKSNGVINLLATS